jgi:hypothetical protein
MLDGGLGEFVLAKGTCCSQRTSPPQLLTVAWAEDAAVHHSKNCAMMSQMGHFRQIETLPTLEACSLYP